MGRRVGILKDVIQQEHNNRVSDETESYHKGVLANQSERNKRTGLHYSDYTDPTSGIRNTSIIGPDGKIGDITDGKAARSTKEQLDFNAKDAGGRFDATKSGRIEVAKAGAEARGDQARKTADAKFDNIKDLLSWKTENGIGDKYEGRVNKDGKLIYVNKSDPTDFHVTDIDTGKMSDADKQKAKIELKAAPNAVKPDTTKTTELKRDKDGKVIQSTTKTTSGSGKVRVQSPDGKQSGMMDAKEAEEAIKHGWKKIS
jgi:hypothetical protein